MCKILAENVLREINNQWVRVTVVLTKARGGLQVHYTDSSGKILEREAYSRSPYYKDKDKK